MKLHCLLLNTLLLATTVAGQDQSDTSMELAVLPSASTEHGKGLRGGRNLQFNEHFMIVSSYTGLALDVTDGDCTTGTNFQVTNRNPGTAQRFRLGPNNSIVSVKCNKVIDIVGGNCAEGTNVRLWDANGTPAQQWTIRDDGAIVNPACDKVIEVEGASNEPFTNARLATFTDSGAQKWNFETNSGVGWAGPFTAPLVGASATALPNGNVLLWSGISTTALGVGGGHTFTSIFNPRNQQFTFTRIANTGHDMFCPGLSFLADGRLVITGGSKSERTTIYDPQNNSWSRAADMNIPRGYQSSATLSNGDQLVIGGSWSGGPYGNRDGEVFANGGWNRKNGIVSDSLGTDDSSPTARDYYMWLFQAPNGRIFKAGPSREMHWIDTGGNGSFQSAGNRADDQDAMTGNAVMYDVGRILTVGGSEDFESGTEGSNRSYTIDIRGNTAIASRSGNMSRKRAHCNSVVLPNGYVIVIGGKDDSKSFTDVGAVYEAEMWNPNNGRWTLLPRMSAARTYHSTAVLTKDGNIVVAGGGLCNQCKANHLDVEIYTPPYLQIPGDRPVINSAPGTIRPGDTINVNINSNDTQTTFALIRISAVTHSTNLDQRRIPLGIVSTQGNNFRLKLPDNPNVVIPGPYFLFAMNAAGKPSVGYNVKVPVVV